MLNNEALKLVSQALEILKDTFVDIEKAIDLLEQAVDKLAEGAS